MTARRTGFWIGLLLLLTAATPLGQPSGPDLGVRDPSLTRVFTPRAAPSGAYEVYRSSKTIDELAAELKALDPEPVADAWKVTRLAPADAFGSEAPYDAPRLARLYVARAPRVGRGSLRTAEGVVSYTLIAPWPDASLAALQPGTMVIVVNVTRLTGKR